MVNGKNTGEITIDTIQVIYAMLISGNNHSLVSVAQLCYKQMNISV